MRKSDKFDLNELAANLIKWHWIQAAAVLSSQNPPVPSISALWDKLQVLDDGSDSVKVAALELSGLSSILGRKDCETLGKIAGQGLSRNEARRSGKTAIEEAGVVRVPMGNCDTGKRRLLELAAQALVAEMYDILRARLMEREMDEVHEGWERFHRRANTDNVADNVGEVSIGDLIKKD